MQNVALHSTNNSFNEPLFGFEGAVAGDTTNYSGSSFNPELDPSNSGFFLSLGFDSDEFFQTHPLYPSYPGMLSSIPADIDIDYINDNFNYAFNLKFNLEQRNGPNIFFITEVINLLSQITLGDMLIIGATAPTKMSKTRIDSIAKNYEYYLNLHQNVLKINKSSLENDLKLLNLLELFYSSKFITEFEYLDIRSQYGTSDEEFFIKNLDRLIRELSDRLIKAQSSFSKSLNYQEAFRKFKFGVIHANGFIQDIDHTFLINEERKFDKYGRVIYIFPIKYEYYGNLRSSKVELCIQPIDKKRYEYRTDRPDNHIWSTYNLLKYFFGPQNIPTTYFSKKTFERLNAAKTYKNTATSKVQLETPDGIIDCIKAATTPVYAFSNQIPKFKINKTEHTIFDFWPELPDILDTFFPENEQSLSQDSSNSLPLYIEYSIYKTGVNTNLSDSQPKQPKQFQINPEIPNYAFETFPERRKKRHHSRLSFILLASHLFVNNVELFKIFKFNTERYVQAIRTNAYERSKFEYSFANSTIPSVDTLTRLLNSKNIQIDPSNPVYEDPAYYWRLIRKLQDDFETPLTDIEYSELLAQHNKSCQEAHQMLSKRKSYSTNILSHLFPENRLEAISGHSSAYSLSVVSQDKLLTLDHSQIPNTAKYSPIHFSSFSTLQDTLKYIPVFSAQFTSFLKFSSIQITNVLNFFNLSTFHIDFYTSSYA